jgi:diguanylate cyclase (GGDEF)-like protein
MKKILIIDDDRLNLMIIEKMMKDLDVSVFKAESGREGLDLIDQHDFALVLLDAQMPEMDGFETANRIRANVDREELPIIIVSAVNKNEEFIKKGYEVGAVDYLFKPVDPILLVSKVRIFSELYQKKRLLEEKNAELAHLNEKLRHEISKRKVAERKLMFQAIRDPLTGLFNRRYLEESLERELSKAKRQKIPLGILMLDVDHFKDFNDTYGHLAGDTVLKNLSHFLIKNSRKEDIACRYGGEEFVLVLPGTNLKVTQIRAELLRAGIENAPQIMHQDEPLPNITISIGVAILPENGQTTLDLIAAADNALYKAKEKGRNRVESAPFLQNEPSDSALFYQTIKPARSRIPTP